MAMHKLVEAMEQERPLSAAVRRAFLTVDRGLFMPAYYEHEGKVWIKRGTARTVVYQNRPLITQLDALGVPNSSSSQPSLMAAMLEALAVQPGMRVLEIGTGTGYNAALLRSLVGDAGEVVSFEIDAALAQQAHDHLQAAHVTGVHVVVTDGRAGYEPRAPYDRIIATAGVRSLPPAWYEQLAVDGISVGNMLGALTPVLIRLIKDQDGRVSGAVLEPDAFFMEARPTADAPQIRAFDWSPYDALPALKVVPEINLAAAFLDRAFLFTLQCLSPTLRLQLRHDGTTLSRWLLDTERYSSVQVPFAPGVGTAVLARGHVLSVILEGFAHWQRQGSPPVEAYQLEVVERTLFARREKECWRLGEMGNDMEKRE